MVQQSPIRKRAGGPGTAGRGSGRGTGGNIPTATLEIPDKLYFRIGEVARICGVPTYVLRFWEGEFPQLKPNKGGTGQRLYRRRDVEMALRIKTLLYDEGYTITGARQAFKAELRSGRDLRIGRSGQTGQVGQIGPDGLPESVDVSHLRAIQKELRELHALLLKAPAPRPPVQTIRASRTILPAPAATPSPVSLLAGPSLKPRLLPAPRPVSPFLQGLFDEPPTEG
jgi:DNA-binding transcriptional MerR regulator